MNRLAVVAMVVCSGCFLRPKQEVNGIVFYEHIWAKESRAVAFQADVDLGPCPSRELLPTQRMGSTPVVVGVRGCGTSAVYVRQLAKRSGPVASDDPRAVWTLTSRSAP